MIQVSVVVPTYRRPELLARCLAALAAQDYDPRAYEVLVVDDAGCAQTARVVAATARQGPMPVRYLRTGGAHGPAAARNRGWRAANGAIVAFTDDDCLPAPDWLRMGTAAFVNGVAGVAGQVLVPLPPRPTDYELSAGQLSGAVFVTANCFYRREALAAVGGFDQDFTAPWREDSDLYFTLLERGQQLVREPAARVVHPVRPARWGSSLAQQRKSQFNALLYKKHPALYRARIQPTPPWSYYLTVGAGVASLVGAAARHRWLSVGAGSVWLALTARFCAQRLQHTARTPAHVAEMVLTSLLIPPLAVWWRLRGAVRFRVVFL